MRTRAYTHSRVWHTRLHRVLQLVDLLPQENELTPLRFRYLFREGLERVRLPGGWHQAQTLKNKRARAREGRSLFTLLCRDVCEEFDLLLLEHPPLVLVPADSRRRRSLRDAEDSARDSPPSLSVSPFSRSGLKSLLDASFVARRRDCAKESKPGESIGKGFESCLLHKMMRRGSKFDFFFIRRIQTRARALSLQVLGQPAEAVAVPHSPDDGAHEDLDGADARVHLPVLSNSLQQADGVAEFAL